MKIVSYIMAIAVVCMMSLSGLAQAHEDGGPSPDGRHQHMMHQPLPPEKKQMLHSAMHQAMEKNKAMVPQMHQLRERMHKILAADKFDRKAFLATHRQMAALRQKMENNKTQAFATVAGKLTPQERMHVVKMMMHKHGKFGHGKFGKFGQGKSGAVQWNRGGAEAPAPQAGNDFSTLNN